MEILILYGLNIKINMKIQYLQCLDGKKLISFYRHDYKEYTDKKGNYYMIDGGQEDYCRMSHPHLSRKSFKGTQQAEISECIKDIREQFTWGQNYTKTNKKLPKTKYVILKDLTTDHIIGILKYFTEKLVVEGTEVQEFTTKQWKLIHLIFIEELLYRNKKKTL